MPLLQERRSLLEIDRARIKTDPGQDRKQFQGIEELAASIEAMGLLQPLTVRDLGNGYYQLIAGERRYRACCRLKMARIPCTVVECDEQEALDLMLLENTARADLNPIEEANAFKRRLDGGQGIEDLARIAGRSVQYIEGRLLLLRLIPSVQLLVQAGHLPISYAQVLSEVPADNQAAGANLAVGCRDIIEYRERVKRYMPNPQGGMFDGTDWQSLQDKISQAKRGKAGRLKHSLDIALQDLGRQLEKLQDPLLPIGVEERLQETRDRLHLAIIALQDVDKLLEVAQDYQAANPEGWQGEYLQACERTAKELKGG